MRLRVKGLLVAASVTLGILLISVMTGNNPLVAARGLVPTPPSVVPPPPGTTPSPEQSAVPPGRQLPDYLVTVDGVAGKVLHWAKTDYNYNNKSPDPANGQPVHVEIWARVGADGIPAISRAISTLSDGTFLQEVVESPDSTTVSLSPRYGVTAPDDTRVCNQRLPAYPSWMRRQLLPLFVNEAMLRRAGFQKGADLTMNLPRTMPLAGIHPLLSYGPGGTSQSWSLQQRENGRANTKTLVVGANSRVLVSRGQLTDRKGNVVTDTWTAYGALDVYDASTIPSAIFAVSQKALEACHG